MKTSNVILSLLLLAALIGEAFTFSAYRAEKANCAAEQTRIDAILVKNRHSDVANRSAQDAIRAALASMEECSK